MARVALFGVNSIAYVRMLISIWNSGDCAVLIDPGTPLCTAIQMMRDADVKKCYLQKEFWNDELHDCFEIDFVKYSVDSTATFLLPDSIYKEFKSDYSKSEAVVIYSSRTTGQAKGIILTHFAINTNVKGGINSNE